MRIRIKLAVIGGLIILLLIPLIMVSEKIEERSHYRDVARHDIAQSWTGEQQVLGPVLVVPYQRVLTNREFDNTARQYVTHETEVDGWLLVVPEELDVDVHLATEVRYRGIYEVPVYTSRLEVSGHFTNTAIAALERRSDVRKVGKPVLSLAVSDARGVAKPPELDWAGTTVPFEPGSALPFRPAGIHAAIDDFDVENARDYAFNAVIDLRGMGSFGFAPAGDSTTIAIDSNWPHPKFAGKYLPVERHIDSDGFSATWQTTRFATSTQDHAVTCSQGDCSALLANFLGVELIEPVDVYVQAQRATKYGLLFIGLTFTAFFLFEVLRKLAIHPIQYGLVGLALAIFYLLLVSFAEHLAFGLAYMLAGIACCGLLAFYISYALGSPGRGLGFGASIGALYGVLYVIIEAEDYAFSMGAILVFVALASVMYITRSIDWYSVSRNT